MPQTGQIGDLWECKGLDEVTCSAEICIALKEQFKFEELGEEFIVSLRKASNGNNAITSEGNADIFCQQGKFESEGFSAVFQ